MVSLASRLLAGLLLMWLINCPATAQRNRGVVRTIAGVPAGMGSVDAPGTAARFNYPTGVAVDRRGAVYVADAGNYTVRRLGPDGVVRTLAGRPGVPGRADGWGHRARFGHLGRLTVDARGNVYVIDEGNRAVRKITPRGRVRTLARADSTRPMGRFLMPTGIAVDAAGVVYVADYQEQTIVRITPRGQVSLLAGGPNLEGYGDGHGAAARFDGLMGLALAPDGQLYAADRNNRRLCRISPSGDVSTLALRWAAWTLAAPGQPVELRNPGDLAADATGNLYLHGQGYLARITPAGEMNVLSNGQLQGLPDEGRMDMASSHGLAVGPTGRIYMVNGPGVCTLDEGNAFATLVGPGPEAMLPEAPLSGLGEPFGEMPPELPAPDTVELTPPKPELGARSVAVAPGGTVYVGTEHHGVYKIGPGGQPVAVAGTNPAGSYQDGPARQLRFDEPISGLAGDAAGRLYLTDTNHQLVRRVGPDDSVRTVAGDPYDVYHENSADGFGRQVRFSAPRGLALDGRGGLLVADFGSHTIRRIAPDGRVSTWAGVPGEAGNVDGPAELARFNGPEGVAVDRRGNVYVTDLLGHTVRRITPAGHVTTLAGWPGVSGSADGPGAAARFNYPAGIAVDRRGTVYVADQQNYTVRRISRRGRVTTLAGRPGQPGVADGPGPAARFNWLDGLAVDRRGRVYVTGKHSLRVIR